MWCVAGCLSCELTNTTAMSVQKTLSEFLFIFPLSHPLSCLPQSFPGFGVSDRDASSQGWALINYFLALWRVVSLCINLLQTEASLTKAESGTNLWVYKHSEVSVTLAIEHDDRASDHPGHELCTRWTIPGLSSLLWGRSQDWAILRPWISLFSQEFLG